MDDNIKNLNDAIDIAKDIFANTKTANIEAINENLEKLNQGALELQEVNKELERVILQNTKDLNSLDEVFKTKSKDIVKAYKSQRDEFFEKAIKNIKEDVFKTNYNWSTTISGIFLLLLTNIITGMTFYHFNKEKNYYEAEQKIIKKLQERKK